MKKLFCLTGLLFAQGVAAAPSITVQALLPDRVMLNINGQTRLLKQGQTSPEGVTLIGSDSEGARLEVGGQQYIYRLGQVLSNTPAPAKAEAVLRIAQDSHGAYRTTGWINGYPVVFLVDTGASDVALNSQDAKRLGLNYANAPTSQVGTANGVATAHEVRLDSVKVGGLELPNIPALVLEGDAPTEVLLGMSFLRQLEMEHAGQMLELRQKY